MNRKLLVLFTALMVFSLVVGSTSVAFAAPLRNDAAITLTYRHGQIKCVVRWNYDEAITDYQITYYRNGLHAGDDVGEPRRPSQRGRISYKLDVTAPGTYRFDVYFLTDSDLIDAVIGSITVE